MYRVAIVFTPGLPAFHTGWSIVKVWRVNPEWATRAVDIDRRSKRKRLLLLYPDPCVTGPCNPRLMLRAYLDALPLEAKLKEEPRNV